MRVALTGLVAAVVVVVSAPELAEACSYPWPEEFAVDPAHANDATPPPAVTDVVWEVHRSDDGGCSESTCGGGGTISIDFVAADDRTPGSRLGIEVRALAGDDEHIAIPQGIWTWVEPGHVFFLFSDENYDIDVTLEITVVDLNGNRSPPVVVHIEDRVLVGCAASGPRGSHTSAILIVLASLFGVRSRSAWGRRGVLPRRA